MAETSNQTRPIASPTDGRTTPEYRRHRRRVQFRSTTTAAFLILSAVAAIALTLTLTVFRLDGPSVRVRELSIGKLDFASGANATLNAVVWVRNPDFASFSYDGLTTTLCYRGAVVGESMEPPGRAAARRTTRVNVTVEVMVGRIVSRPRFDSDLISGLMNVSSRTRVGGKMGAFVVFGRKLTVRMDCNMTLNITSRAIERHRCK